MYQIAKQTRGCRCTICAWFLPLSAYNIENTVLTSCSTVLSCNIEGHGILEAESAITYTQNGLTQDQPETTSVTSVSRCHLRY